jgi:hypothetical protein
MSDNSLCRQALTLWLRWSAEERRLSESLYQDRGCPDRIERLLDGLDNLRQQAVAATQEALNPARAKRSPRVPAQAASVCGSGTWDV